MAESALRCSASGFVRETGGLKHLDLMVEGVHCGGCVRRIERALGAETGVVSARVNLTTRRLAVTWDGLEEQGERLIRVVEGEGYRAIAYDPERLRTDEQQKERMLLRAMAVAGFGTANVMLLSVGVWAGQAQGMGPATQGLLHWFSALIALPVIAYAGQPFFGSAFSMLRRGRTNMDVPIALAIVLAAAMSLFETIRGGDYVYFESAVMLLFFLLVGRFLDRRARGKARSAAERLATLDVAAVTLIDTDGTTRQVALGEVGVGDRVLIAAGERVAVDGRVVAGSSDLDNGLITGESIPVAAGPGAPVFAGTLNVGAPLQVEVEAVGETTLLAEIVRLMEAAEQRKARFVVLADRVARLYAPFVHGLALLAFAGWLLLGGLAWQEALLIAVAVLIITCPCALGLAVPAVQVIATGRLFRGGILVKSPTALERLAAVDTVVVDKTGTLTLGRPELDPGQPVEPGDLALAASLAGASRHPLARALCAAAPAVMPRDGVEEVPGKGLRLATAEGEIRLGSRSFCDVPDGTAAPEGPELWLQTPAAPPARFAFVDRPRPDLDHALGALERAGYALELLSGDHIGAVQAFADRHGIRRWQGSCSPRDKLERLEALRAEGRKVLMVGDGLNDAPSLAAAHVSMAPASAIDISRTAADAVFQGERLEPVADLLTVARASDRLVRQNLALALGYNLVAIPIAVAGYASPLVAALSMSASSLVVVGNALRLTLGGARP